MKHKRIRKVGLLNDIMQNEEFLTPGKVHNVGEAKPNENADDKLEATSKWEAQNPEHGRQLSDRNITLKFLAEEDVQNKDRQPIRSERMNKIDAIRNDYRQPILMQLLKKIPTKRAVTPNGDLEIETNYCSTGISQPDGDTSAGKCLGHKIEVHKVRQRKRETIFGRKKNMLPQMKAGQPHLSLQQDNNTGKDSAPKKLPNDFMQKKYIHSSKSVIINEKILHIDLQIQDSKHRKNTSSNGKRKAHLADKHFYQMHFPKPGGHRFKSGNSLPLERRKVTKKRRTVRAWNKGAVDDIPMDIVELLANKLHDKRLRNVEYASKSTDHLSWIKKNLENRGVTGVSELHGNEGPKAEHEKLIQRKSQADTTRNDLHENAYDQPKAYCYSTNCDQGKNFYPIQQIKHTCHKATRPADQNSSGYISALNLPAVWSGGYYHASANTNPAGFIQESELLSKDGRTELFGSGVGTKSIGPTEHQGNSCKLVRPVPRIGVLVSVLQKEIANRSCNFRSQSLIKVGSSNQVVSPSINAISRAELSKWVAQCNFYLTSRMFSDK